MKAVWPASSLHQTSCEFVNNHNFAVFDNVIRIFYEQFFGFKRLQKMMCILRIDVKQIFNAQKFLSVVDTVFG